MDILSVFLYIPGMDYFNGLTFLHWGRNERCSSWIDKHFDGYYTLQYIHTGNIDFCMGGKSHVIPGGSCWLTFPGPRIQFGVRDRSRTWHHHYFAFRGPRMRSFLTRGLFPIDWRPPFATISEPERFHAYFDQLLTYLYEGGARTARAVHSLEGLLLYLHENKIPDVPHTPHIGSLRGLAEAIRKSPENAWDFRAEAYKLNLSEAHFRRIFRLVNACSPARFLNQVRLARGAEMLRNTDLPVKTIAEKTRFYDVYYFSKLFRRHYFLAPGRYRREFMTHDIKSGEGCPVSG